VPPVWLQSITTLLAVIEDLDRQLAVLDGELRPVARADDRVKLLITIPGIGELLGLTLASEIGDIARFPSAGTLVGYYGLTATIKQSGQSSRTGRLSKAGPNTLRWAAVEARPAGLAADEPLASPLHRHQAPPRQEQPRQGCRRAQGPDRRLARPRPPATVQAQPRRGRHPGGVSGAHPAPASSSIRLAHRGPQMNAEAGTAATRPRAPTDAPKETSAPTAGQDRPELPMKALDDTARIQRDEWLVGRSHISRGSMTTLLRNPVRSRSQDRRREGDQRAHHSLSRPPHYRRDERQAPTPRPGT
jgi:Transposase IS116/IS110/IS902 family